MSLRNVEAHGGRKSTSDRTRGALRKATLGGGKSQLKKKKRLRHTHRRSHVNTVHASLCCACGVPLCEKKKGENIGEKKRKKRKKKKKGEKKGEKKGGEKRERKKGEKKGKEKRDRKKGRKKVKKGREKGKREEKGGKGRKKGGKREEKGRKKGGKRERKREEKGRKGGKREEKGREKGGKGRKREEKGEERVGTGGNGVRRRKNGRDETRRGTISRDPRSVLVTAAHQKNYLKQLVRPLPRSETPTERDQVWARTINCMHVQKEKLGQCSKYSIINVISFKKKKRPFFFPDVNVLCARAFSQQRHLDKYRPLFFPDVNVLCARRVFPQTISR